MGTDLAYAFTKMQKPCLVINSSFGIVNPGILLNQVHEYTVEGVQLRDRGSCESVAGRAFLPLATAISALP